MPGTPITVHGEVTVKVDGAPVVTVAQGFDCTVPYGSAYSDDPRFYTVASGGEIVHPGGTYTVPSGKTAVIAGPGLGIP